MRNSDDERPKYVLSATEYIDSIFESSDRIAVLVRNAKRGETIQRISTRVKVTEIGRASCRERV